MKETNIKTKALKKVSSMPKEEKYDMKKGGKEWQSAKKNAMNSLKNC